MILPIAESSVVHRILLELFQRFSIDLLWKIRVPPFPARSMEIKPLGSVHGNQAAGIGSSIAVGSNAQTAPWKPSRWDRVQHCVRIERGDGSISSIVHHRKPAAVSPGSQRCSEGAQVGPWGDCSGLSMVHDERDRDRARPGRSQELGRREMSPVIMLMCVFVIMRVLACCLCSYSSPLAVRSPPRQSDWETEQRTVQVRRSLTDSVFGNQIARAASARPCCWSARPIFPCVTHQGHPTLD